MGIVRWAWQAQCSETERKRKEVREPTKVGWAAASKGPDGGDLRAAENHDSLRSLRSTRRAVWLCCTKLRVLACSSAMPGWRGFCWPTDGRPPTFC